MKQATNKSIRTCFIRINICVLWLLLNFRCYQANKILFEIHQNLSGKFLNIATSHVIVTSIIDRKAIKIKQEAF